MMQFAKKQTAPNNSNQSLANNSNNQHSVPNDSGNSGPSIQNRVPQNNSNPAIQTPGSQRNSQPQTQNNNMNGSRTNMNYPLKMKNV